MVVMKLSADAQAGLKQIQTKEVPRRKEKSQEPGIGSDEE